MKTKKRIFLFAFGVLCFVGTHTLDAQVTIGGETAPVKGATLDLSPTGGYVGGLKLPNVELTSLTAIPTTFDDAGSTTDAELVGTVVYNINASVGGKGMYMWDGSKWQAMFSTGSSSSLDNIYPVGSIYMSVSSVNPGSVFGGTWVAWGSGQVPVGVKTSDTDFATVEKPGGDKTASHDHTITVAASGILTSNATTLTTSHLPSHTHSFSGTTSTKSLTGEIANFALQSSSVGVYTKGVFTDRYISGELAGYTTASKTITASYADGVTMDASHNHTFSGTTGASGAATGHTHTIPTHTHTATATSVSLSTLQPYITCYMWKRTN